MTVKERIKLFISHLNLTNQQFEKNCGLANGYIANMRKGVGEDALERISNRYPQLSKSWLLTGDGEMLRSDQVRDPLIFEPQPVELQTSIGITMEYLVSENKKKDAEIEKLTKERDDALRQLKEQGKQSTKAGIIPSEDIQRS